MQYNDFTCKICSYKTNRKANYTRHINSKKHKLSSVTVIPDKIDENITRCKSHDGVHYILQNEKISQNNVKCEVGIPKKHEKTFSHIKEHAISDAPLSASLKLSESSYKCKYCDMIFKKKYNLSRHRKLCDMKTDSDKHKEFIDIIQKLKDDKNKARMLLREKEKQLEKFEEYHNNMMDNFGSMGARNVNAITYIINQYQNAPHIEPIKPKDLKLTFETNRDVENVISYYRNKILVDRIIEAILFIHKKKDPSKQAVWVTDVSRNNYIIKELLHDNDSHWVIDKKGIKSEKYLVKPILDFIRKKIYDYLQIAGNLLTGPTTTKQDRDIIMDSQKDGSELIKEIDSNIISTDIIRKLSKHMHYEKNENDIPLIEEIE